MADRAAVQRIMVEEVESVLRAMLRVDGLVEVEVQRRARLCAAGVRRDVKVDGLLAYAAPMSEGQFRAAWREVVERRLRGDLADLRPS